MNSPYAYLAAERIDDLLDVEWVPVLVGAMFKAAGRSSWGLGPGRADGIRKIERRAAERGLPPLRWPEPWPGNSLMAMRAAVFGGKPFAREAFRVHFVDGRTLDDPASVVLAAERAGLDPDAVLEATQDPAIKVALRANTDRALALGAFGVPTVVVDGEVIWGDDRLEEAVR
ncbi:MAG: 2-hydroxychromene-2-carboxylate isomerase [Solirubrobacterales bacterium]